MPVAGDPLVRLMTGKLKREARLRYLADQAIWLWLGLAAISGLVGYLFDPQYAEKSAVGRAVAPYDVIWVGGFALAGVMLIWGIVQRKLDIEAVGLVVLSGALAVNWVAVLFVNPSNSAVLILPALVLSALLRVWVMLVRAKESREAKEDVTDVA